MIESLAREPQCDGKHEGAVQRVQGQLKTLTLDLKSKLGMTIHAKSPCVDCRVHGHAQFSTDITLLLIGKLHVQSTQYSVFQSNCRVW